MAFAGPVLAHNRRRDRHAACVLVGALPRIARRSPLTCRRSIVVSGVVKPQLFLLAPSDRWDGRDHDGSDCDQIHVRATHQRTDCGTCAHANSAGIAHLTPPPSPHISPPPESPAGPKQDSRARSLLTSRSLISDLVMPAQDGVCVRARLSCEQRSLGRGGGGRGCRRPLPGEPRASLKAPLVPMKDARHHCGRDDCVVSRCAPASAPSSTRRSISRAARTTPASTPRSS
jgi:hypothetical protein